MRNAKFPWVRKMTDISINLTKWAYLKALDQKIFATNFIAVLPQNINKNIVKSFQD